MFHAHRLEDAQFRQQMLLKDAGACGRHEVAADDEQLEQAARKRFFLKYRIRAILYRLAPGFASRIAF